MKVNKNLTELVIVSDRSGSMASIRVEVERAINDAIKEQKEQDGRCNLTFLEFDTKVDVLHNGTDLKKLKEWSYRLKPRSMTRLNDAIIEAITLTEKRVDTVTKQKDNPGLVVFIVFTDGLENASYAKYTDVAKRIEKIKNRDWQLNIIGAGVNAEKYANAYGIDTKNVVSTTRGAGAQGISLTSRKLTTARKQVAMGISCFDTMSYTSDDKTQLSQGTPTRKKIGVRASDRPKRKRSTANNLGERPNGQKFWNKRDSGGRFVSKK